MSSGKVVDHTDPDRRLLGANKLAAETHCRDGRGRISKKGPARRCHGDLPVDASHRRNAAAFSAVFGERSGESTRVMPASGRARAAPSKIDYTPVRCSPVVFARQAVVPL